MQPLRHPIAFALLAALLLAGCMKPNPLIDTLGDANDESGEPDTSDTSDTDTMDTGETDTPDLPGGASNSCAPTEVFEPACDLCLGVSCCDLASECLASDDCACLSTCLLEGGNNGTCKSACDGAKADELPELDALLACAADLCDASC